MGEGAKETERSESRQATEEASAWPTADRDFMQRSGMKTKVGVTSPYALFLSPSHLER
jgi:hypothetical protein